MPKSSKIETIILVTLFLLAATILLSPWVASAESLVPCGNKGWPPCTLCHLYVLAKNVIDFSLFDLALPIAIIMLLIGGIILLTSTGSPEKLTRGKTILINTLFGIIIAFAAWIIISTLLSTLGFNLSWADAVQRSWSGFPTQCGAGINAPPTASTLKYCVYPENNMDITMQCARIIEAECTSVGGQWQDELPVDCVLQYCTDESGNQRSDLLVVDPCAKIPCIQCEALTPAGLCSDQPPAECGGPLQADTQALVDKKVTFSSSADCDAAHADRNKEELLGGNTALTTCCPDCNCKASNTCFAPTDTSAATLNGNILTILNGLADDLDCTSASAGCFQVESLTTGKHNPNSQHYAGEAVDITQPRTNFTDFKNRLNKLCPPCQVQCEKNEEEEDCSTGNPDHIHVGL